MRHGLQWDVTHALIRGIMGSTNMDTIVLGGGCFWCLDAAYRLIEGVESSECGYAGGALSSPTYEKVCTGTTGHAEVVRVTLNSEKISLATILDIFWTLHDPTTPNRQGADVGSHYRSIVLMTNKSQQEPVNEAYERANDLWDGSLVTEIGFLDRFYVAEPEHQDYFRKHPERGYCQVVINPKITKLKKRYRTFLRDT